MRRLLLALVLLAPLCAAQAFVTIEKVNLNQTLYVGEDVAISATLKNTGTAEASGYLVTLEVWDSTECLYGDPLVCAQDAGGAVTGPDLSINERAKMELAVWAPDHKDTHTFKVVVDGLEENLVVEAEEKPTYDPDEGVIKIDEYPVAVLLLLLVVVPVVAYTSSGRRRGRA